MMQVCPHGMLSPFHSGLREGILILSLLKAAKAARVAFPPRSKETGLLSYRVSYVYCRSGRRTLDAGQRLLEVGTRWLLAIQT
ncbi:MAG: hypothetical protein HLUCCO16_07825 [Phormidium sp. OSCR]|nr:MAG: hypothetical protein HLUCCO16_07825 [Phormidium sp. OSCR]